MTPPEARGRRGWVSWRALRESILRLHRGYVAVPREARGRWWRVLLAGAVLLQALSLGLVALTRRLERLGLLAWERDAILWIDAHAPFSFNTAIWLEGIANGFVLWGVVLYAAAVAAWLGHPMLSLTFLVGHTAAYLPVLTGWSAWDRVRPDLIARGLGSPGGFLHSFPSGHMAQAAFAHGLLLYLWLRAARHPLERAAVALVFLLLAAVVAASRLRLGAHWPSDVVGGFVLGVAWLGVAVVALRRVPPRA